MTPSILWFRRDLRLSDHPALLAAAQDGPVLPVFVLDEALLAPSGPARRAFLIRSLRALDRDLRRHGPGLVVRGGRPEEVLRALVAEVGAAAVHVSADFGPYGAARDERVATTEQLNRLPGRYNDYALKSMVEKAPHDPNQKLGSVTGQLDADEIQAAVEQVRGDAADT